MQIREIQATDNAAIKKILQDDLRAADLAIPGAAYFDENLDRLSDYYAAASDRKYWVVVNAQGEVVGGAGCAAYDAPQRIAELQKLYLRSDAQGHGLSYQLIARVEAFARQAGYRTLYLETHHRLAAAVHVYQKLGFTRLPGPLKTAVHTAMDQFYQKTLI